jgi:hypothetical protein
MGIAVTRRGNRLNIIALTFLTMTFLALAVFDSHAGDVSDWLSDNFIDSEDGAFDTSNWLARGGFMPIPIIVTEPAVDNGLGLAAVFIHGLDGGSGTPPDVTGGAGLVTGNDSRAVALFHQGNYFDNRLKYAGALASASVNLELFGEGRLSNIYYTIDTNFMLHNARYRIGDSDFFAGARWVYQSTEVTFKNRIRPSVIGSRPLNIDLSGLGPTLYYDSRDNIFTPTNGIFARIFATRYDDAWGSDRNFSTSELTFLGFRELFEDWDFGLKVDISQADDNTPFYMKPFISLRGIPAMRYQGDFVTSTEVEARYSIDKRWSILGFGGVGRASRSIGRWDNANTESAFGGGFRYLMARKMGVHTGIDIAKGPEETVFYIVFGHAWARE